MQKLRVVSIYQRRKFAQPVERGENVAAIGGGRDAVRALYSPAQRDRGSFLCPAQRGGVAGAQSKLRAKYRKRLGLTQADRVQAVICIVGVTMPYKK